MARLRGELTSIDLMKPFSVRSGGRVIDLSRDLHFEIQWDGSNVIERFTGDILGGSGHTSSPGPANHTGATINGSECFSNLIPNISWANDNFTISFWVKFIDTGFSPNYDSTVNRQFDYIAVRPIISPPITKTIRFSTYLKKNSTGDGLRSYFGLRNFYVASDPDYTFNFCDTFDNTNLITRSYVEQSVSLNYPSEFANEKNIPFGEWTHVVIRNKTRKNGSNGICDVWINGERRSLYLQNYSNESGDKPLNRLSPGDGVIGENQLLKDGKIIFPILGTASYFAPKYQDFMSSNNDRLFLANHSYFQLSKWDRILSDEEIIALHKGTLDGVYVERFTSISKPPRKLDLGLILNNNSEGAFDDTKTILGNRASYVGKNSLIDSFDGEESLELSTNLNSIIIQNNLKDGRKSTKEKPFEELLQKSMLNCIDGTTASTAIKIDISSVQRNDNLQYAGRTDSKSAKTLQYATTNYSMFLSSALDRHGRLDNSYKSLDLGVAGTGFLYYSPIKGCWVEKRSQHENSLGTNTQTKDSNGAVNTIEVNSYANDDHDGGWLSFDLDIFSQYSNNAANLNLVTGTFVSYSDLRYTYSSKLQVTGTNEIMRQFTASPQLGYFTSKKEHLQRAGYENVGSPTIVFGAPFSPKYHAFNDESIKLDKFISSPLLLKKVILKIPVEIQRINEINEGQYIDLYKPAAYFNFESTASSPDTIPDRSGNDHIATLSNLATVDINDTPGNITGRGSLDLTYDALTTLTNDNLVVDNSNDIKLGIDGLSISFWVKFSDFAPGKNHNLFAKVSSTGLDSEYYFFYDRATDRLRFRISDIASSIYSTDYIERSVSSAVANGYIQDSKWHHFVVTYDGSNSSTGMKIFIDRIRRDNTSSSSGTFTTARSHTFKLFFGSRGTDTADLRGKIASITIWKRSLAQEYIDLLYSNCLNSFEYSWNWTENVTMRKDMDNYVFFLYRQRRANSSNAIDSLQDISSSMRFLIGSGSVCVYNSSSFGLSNRDGFSEQFGINTPVVSSLIPGVPATFELNEVFRRSNAGEDLITGESLENISSPLHTPAVSFNTNLNDFSDNSTYIEKKYLEIQIDPAYVLGGYPNSTLMYVTTSKGHLSTSFHGRLNLPAFDPTLANRLFNWYPQKGTNAFLEQNTTPPISTIFQNFWFGGTQQPVVVASASDGYEPPGSIERVPITPYYQFDNDIDILRNQNSLLQWPKFSDFTAYGLGFVNLGSTAPEFDIEIARTGFSFYNLISTPFNTSIQIVNDSRGITATLAKNAKPPLAAVFQRSEIITASTYNDEPSVYLTGTFTIKTGLDGCSFSDLLSSLTIGYSPSSPNAGRNVYNPYILLPEDELVLGLDAGITPPPDIAPYFGKNLTDYNENGSNKPAQKAFVNPILKEQIWHYAGNSYMRILPGSAEMILIGDYIRDGEKVEMIRTINSSNMSTTIGNDPVLDQYDNAEVSAYVGTYQSQVITGTMSNNTRGVDYDAALRVDSRSGTVGRFVVASNDSISLLDQYVSGVLR